MADPTEANSAQQPVIETSDAIGASHGSPHGAPATGRRLAGLTLAALGVVYGDIGTSPLYALRECFYGEHGLPVTRENVLGVLSLIVWALLLVITVKYVLVVLRADNRGEGGILALMALVRPVVATRPRTSATVVALGLFGAALLYGDGMITPAISVLSAVEGLSVATPFFEPFVLPITIAILVMFFAMQRRGTGGVGAIFGPITLLWFVVLAALGLRGLQLAPEVLGAASPHHALAMFVRTPQLAFLVLGAVFLVVTGGEALYADLSHFGKRPIRLAWFALVLPCLLLNYMGQGALILAQPEAAHNPFYRLAPGWALYPLVLLATLATIIASQAVVSGAFTLTRQAMQMGFCPRLPVRQTSPDVIGQIYIAPVNWALLVACVGLVLGFRSSTHLAAAYGVAVTTTMVLTTLLMGLAMRQLWGWSRRTVLLVVAGFLVIDLAFFGASLAKVLHGGWFPLVVAALAYLLFATWRRGRQLLADRMRAHRVPLGIFVKNVESTQPLRVKGTAVFMTTNLQGVPITLLHNLRQNKVLHEQVVLLSVDTDEVPFVPDGERVELERMEQGFWKLRVRYGFMDDVDVPTALERVREQGLLLDPADTTFFLAAERLIPTPQPGMAIWREWLFTYMSQNSQNATAYFRLPTEQVIEIGTQVEL